LNGYLAAKVEWAATPMLLAFVDSAAIFIGHLRVPSIALYAPMFQKSLIMPFVSVNRVEVCGGELCFKN
jgi:hypothetical protein